MKRMISVLSVAALMAMMTAAPAFAQSVTTPEVPSQTITTPAIAPQTVEVPSPEVGADVNIEADAQLSIGL